MRTIHAILAIQQPLFRDSLSSCLSREYDFRIVANAESEPKLMKALRELLDGGSFDVDDPVVVIATIDAGAGIPAVCSRLLLEFPEVTFIGIEMDSAQARSYQLRIETREVGCSLPDLIASIRDCTKTVPPW